MKRAPFSALTTAAVERDAEPTTTILASGPNWVLRRDVDGPAVLEVRDMPFTASAPDYAGSIIVAVELPSSLVALIVGTPKHENAEG